jgi:DNA helicase MCM8
MSNELLRVRRVWERHDFALPCTEGDAEVVTVFEGFFLGRGRSLLAGQEQFADVTVEYGDFLSTMRLDVFDFEAMLFAQPARVLLQLGVAVDLALAAPDRRAPPGGATLRLRNVVPQLPLAQLRSEQVGRFVAVRATVTRASAVRPLVVAASFSCGKCGAGEADDSLRVKFPDGNFASPTCCASGECKSRSFDLKRGSAAALDYQKIKVQQQFDEGPGGDDGAGRVPRHLDVECRGHALVDLCVPGDVVVVSGVLRCVNSAVAAGRHDKRALATATAVLYLDANSVVNASREAERGVAEVADAGTCDVVVGGGDNFVAPAALVDPRGVSHFGDADLAIVKQIAGDDDVLGLLVGSLAPAIYGHELVKLGLLLGLFGGTKDDDDDDDRDAARAAAARPGARDDVALDFADPALAGKAPRRSDRVSVRANSHVLVVGDPGLGKSQMLRAAAVAAPRSVYVCGNTTTATGLTVSLNRDADGAPALEAGALVLADRGACCIDEFDKMDGGQHAGLLEAMEQQQISIAKAGVVASLSARCSVLAAANPVGGQYDRSRTVSENVKLSAPLLSRFDLVFILVDDPDSSHDALLSRHVIGMHRAGAAVSGRGARAAVGSPDAGDADALALQRRLRSGADRALRDPLPLGHFRKYVAYARRFVSPKLDVGAALLLQRTYLEMRAAHGANPAKTMPITTRQLESLVRLAQARAKLELRDNVTEDDARDVVALLRESVRDACTTPTGAVDFSRAVGGMSASRAVKALVAALHADADARRDPYFTMADVKDLARRAGVETSKPIADLVDILRDQSYLMYQKRDDGSFAYKLTSCQYEGSQTSTHLMGPPPPRPPTQRRVY